MKIEKFHIYLADLNPRLGTKSEKVRPVVVIQTDLLNNVHPSTVVCPLTSNLVKDVTVLRIHLQKRESGLEKDSDILVDQIRAIDNRRFKKPAGKLASPHRERLLENLKVLLLE